MYIEQRRRGRVPQNWIDHAEDGLNQFISEANDCMNNELFEKEGSQGDTEASYLSQLIFRNLFRMFGFKSEYCYQTYISVNEIGFRFEIMHNPNYINPQNNKQKRMGKKISESNKEKYSEWRDKYHTLGNFAPYPDIKIDNLGVQNYHESKCYERWDLTLAELQKQWVDNIGMSFAEYLIATGQIIYDKDVFNSLPSGDITFQWYLNKANDILDRDITILNFNRDSENKILNDENVEYAIDSILKLIELRTKILIMLLKEQNSGLELKIEGKIILQTK